MKNKVDRDRINELGKYIQFYDLVFMWNIGLM